MNKDTIKLSDILIPQPKSKIKAGEGKNTGKYKFFTSSNLQNKFLNEYQYDEPALIFGTGGNASIHFCEEKFATSTDCLVFFSEEKQLLKSVYLYLSGNIQILESGFKGAGLKHISRQYILDISIPLPGANEQRKIAAVLDKVSDLIAKRRQQLDKLDEMVKARFVEIFGDPVTNPKGWKIDKLGSYMTTLTDFSANGSYELLDSNVVMYDEPNYAVMVRTIDLEAGNLDNGVKYIDQKAYELLSKSKLYGGELIMNKIGSAGKIYIMPHIGKPASLGRNAFMFRFDERINMVFLYALLTSDYGTVEIQQYVRGAVTKTITKASTKAIRIIVPPIELQNRFATFVEQTEKTKLIISHSLEKLETLKKALMQEYFG